MILKYVLLLFCAFVASMKNREPLHKFSTANAETWKQLAIEEEQVLKAVDEKFNENFEKFDAEMKETLKSLNAEDPNKTLNELAAKCETDVRYKSIQEYAAMGTLKIDYEKIAMQAVRNYYKLMWYFIVKRKHPGINAKDYIFKIMWSFLDAGHRDFGADYSVPYYRPPLMNRGEPLKLYKRIELESANKCEALLQERFLNWTVHRYLKQSDGKRLKAISDSLAEALEKDKRDFDVRKISLEDARLDFGGNFPFSNSAFKPELEAALKTFIQGLNVQVKTIGFYNDFVCIYLQS